MRRKIKPPTIDSCFAYTNYKSFREHLGLSKDKRKYYRRKGYIKMYYVPRFNYKRGEFIGYNRIFAFDHHRIRKYEKSLPNNVNNNGDTY